MSRRGLLLFAAMCLIWGIPYLFIRIAVGELTPATLVFARTALAALVLVPIALARGDVRPVLARWPAVVAFAAVEIVVPWLFLSSAERRLSSSLAALLIAAVPLVATVISLALRRGDRVGPGALAGLLLGLAGVAAIVGFDLHATGIVPLGEMGLVVVGYALGPIILARYLGGLSGVSVMALALLLSAAVYAPVAALQVPHALPSAGVLVAVGVLGVVCTALAFLLFPGLIAEIGPVRATVITYINPAVAALLGVVALGETFTGGMGAGFVLVLLGSGLATGQLKRPHWEWLRGLPGQHSGRARPGHRGGQRA